MAAGEDQTMAIVREQVGTWPYATEERPKLIEVYYMTSPRAAWVSRSEASDR